MFRVLPIVALCISAAAFAAFGLVLMQSLDGPVRHADVGLAISLVVFVSSALAVVGAEVRSVAHRFERPEQQVRLALQRIRQGDVGFRVSLRRGESLAGVAFECNELLDWLNVNPPAGVQTGGDIVDLGPAEDEAARS